MFNDFRGYDERGNPVAISIPPTLLISTIGVIPNIQKIISPEFKNVGDVVYLLGETNDELGASEYYKMLARKNGNNALGNNVPKVNLKNNLKTYKALERAIQNNLVNSSVSVNSGGLAVALSRASVGGMLGCEVSIKNLHGDAKSIDAKLFSESQGRILVSVSPQNIKAFEQVTKGVFCSKLGKVTKEKITITDRVKVVETNVKKLHTIYHAFSNKMR